MEGSTSPAKMPKTARIVGREAMLRNPKKKKKTVAVNDEDDPTLHLQQFAA